MTAQPAEHPAEAAQPAPEPDPRIDAHARVPSAGRAPSDPVGRAAPGALTGLLRMADARLHPRLRAEIARGAENWRAHHPRPVQLGDNAREDADDVRRRTEARAAVWWNRPGTARFAAARPDGIDDQQYGADLRAWLTEPYKPTLYLHGKQGTGKTHCAYALGNAAVEAGLWVVAWSMPDLNAALRPSAEGDPQAWPAVTRCNLLIIDDVGAEKHNEWTQEQFYRLIDYRYREHQGDPQRPRRHRRTIITTNVDGSDFLDRYGAPLVSRILDGAMRRKFEGQMRRSVAPW